MNGEEKEKDNSDEFGRVIDALHNKQKLPSLRTYQGDVAEFIKEKNESVISIAAKEKEREEEEVEEEKEKKKEEKRNFYQTPTPTLTPTSQETTAPKQTSNREGLHINFTMIILSLLLIVGGVAVSFYIFEILKREPLADISIKGEIIPYNNLVTVANITNETLGPELAKLSSSNGLSVLEISDANGKPVQTSGDFFSFLNVSLPPTLRRTLNDEYAIGAISQNKESALFIVITVSDFGRAFSAMLDWEEGMERDLFFLNPVASAVQTASTTIPMKQDSYSWKDIIIKNKDTRGLANQKNQAKIAYAFLDKNTILITNNLSAIASISAIYASRPIAR